MKWTWAVLVCLLTALRVAAGDGEQLGADELPPGVTDQIRKGFGAEPLHGGKEIEGGKECYVVTAAYKGEVIELYTSPDGTAIARKTDSFSLEQWVRDLVRGDLILLLVLAVVGATTRG